MDEKGPMIRMYRVEDRYQCRRASIG